MFVQNLYIDTIGELCNLINKNFPQFKTSNLTGGFTLNCPTNSLLSEKFNNLNINPLPGYGDTAIAIGAGVALQKLIDLKVKKDISNKLSSAFLPLNLNTEFIEEDYLKYGLKKIQSPISIPAFIAHTIAEKKILSLFRRRFEVGPKAFGNRSIIATSTSIKIRDEINTKKA